MRREKEISFIIGMGRSGTTLLSALLNQHPEVHATPEAVFLIFFLDAWKNKTRYSENDIDMIFEQIQYFAYTHPFFGWTFDEKEMKRSMKEFVKDRDVTFHALCSFIYEGFKVDNMDKSGARILADKNPSYLLFADKLSEAFPQAKFIYIVRDYRANILSRKESPDLRTPELRHNAWLWKFYNLRALTFMKDNPAKVIMIKYEDLVEHKEREMKRAFTFLGLDPALVRNESQYSNLKKEGHKFPEGQDGRFEKKYGDLNKPVNKDRLEAWKTGLSAKEISICDSICHTTGEKFGYLPSGRIGTVLPYMKQYFAAKMEIWKERWIYHLSPKIKLARLKKVYTYSGYIQKK